ncbi:LysR family transcriptional regulator [Cohaesibacter celericrescens]|uniref:LysR family transcriptional regulator n=1 Tax=Cohaesibacter celericrescens TaxID=2067669 RepID=UPI003565BB05
MDTDSLRLFVLAAEKLNISAAGRSLGLAPAVASARLAKLENEVGADLLHRSTRKVSLSLQGAEFLPFAREILQQSDAGLAALGQGKSNATGTLRFTAPSTFAQLHIAPILPDFQSEHPDVTLDLRLSDVQFDLIEGSFDLALRNSSLDDSNLKGRKLANDRRILCASPAYLRDHGTPQMPDDLARHYLIAFRDQKARPLIGRDGQTSEFDPRKGLGRIILDDGLSQKIVTCAGAGISSNSIWSVYQEIKDGRLIQILPDYEIADKTALWLVYPKTNVLSPKVRVFMDFLLKRIGKSPIWDNLAI